MHSYTVCKNVKTFCILEKQSVGILYFLIYFVSFFYFIILFYFISLASLGLRCCTRAFSSCGEQGLLFVAVHRLLIVVASLVAEQGSRHGGFNSCSTWAQ